MKGKMSNKICYNQKKPKGVAIGALKEEYLPYYTIMDYISWDGKWELISGITYAMASAPVP